MPYLYLPGRPVPSRYCHTLSNDFNLDCSRRLTLDSLPITFFRSVALAYQDLDYTYFHCPFDCICCLASGGQIHTKVDVGHTEAIGKLLISEEFSPVSWTSKSGRTLTRELREKVFGAI